MTETEKKIQEEFLSEEFIAKFLGFKMESIQVYRYTGSDKIPPFKKLGKVYVYPVKDFWEWVKKHPTIKAIA